MEFEINLTIYVEHYAEHTLFLQNEFVERNLPVRGNNIFGITNNKTMEYKRTGQVQGLHG